MKARMAGALAVVYNNACRLAFAFSLFAAFFLVPRQVIGKYSILLFAFALSFALTMACVTYAMRENMRKARSTEIISLLASGTGFVALEACGLSLACGTAGMGILLLVLPSALVGFLSEFGAYVVAASILLQIASLYAMGCLRGKTLRKIASS